MKLIMRLFLTGALVVSLLVGCTQVDVGTQKNKYTYEQAAENLVKLYDRVVGKTVDDPGRYDGGSDEFYSDEDVSTLLPDFYETKQPVVYENRDDSVFAVVVSSTEKAVNNSTDRWLIDMAEAYNKKSDRLGSIRLYGVASGEAFDYIRSGKFVPDAFTPSNTLWGDALGLTPYVDRVVGNVAGIVSKAGISIDEVVSGVENSALTFGYTNPLASSTGANFLLQYLHGLRDSDSFETFQKNIALVSYTTPQMRNAALSGKLDAFVYESQQFYTGATPNGTTLADTYKFVPFGVRHDSPMYVLNESRRVLIEDFTQFCLLDENQNKAEKYGFNRYNEYKGASTTGYTLLEDQAHYKEKKSGGRPVVSVFVCDVSGSMNGSPLYELKQSLRACAGVISQESYVGLVTFATDVAVNLPIAPFDSTMQSRFREATRQLVTRGGTAMYSGLIVAEKLILDYKEANSGMDAIYRIFVLTDGENTDGLSKGVTIDVLQSLGIPIYTIGYNAGSGDLGTLAGLNEAAYVKVDDTNVGYALANFFRAEF
ncbi:VWA domain-containing protein [Clostridia bacterium]|nr:VWA domain-containing protein [Clostridia bacterium]